MPTAEGGGHNIQLCALMHGVHYGTAPKYMKELVTPTSSKPGRELFRSAATMNYDIERTD